MIELQILHTNDFHNHLTAQQAARLGKRRAALGDRGLLLDAGDAVSAGNMTYHRDGEPILSLMTDSGYDAMTVGNREFHFTQAGFSAKLSRAGFPVLCANVTPTVRDEKAALPTGIRSFITRCAGNLEVTIFGVTVPMITRRMLASRVSAYVFDDPVEVAVQLARTLRGGCELLVCMSHSGLSRDREIAARCPEIDLIIGGHTHAVLDGGERVSHSLIVQTGSYAHNLGVVDVAGAPGDLRISSRLEAL